MLQKDISMQKQQTGDLYEIYYDGEKGIIKIEYLGKVDKGDEDGESAIDKYLKSAPKITARYEQLITTIKAKAEIEAPGKIAKVELIYQDKVIDKETKTSNLTEEINFNVKQYGTGWYKVRAVAENGKIRNTWVEVERLDPSLTAPEITVEPVKPNGEVSWYKRVENNDTGTDTEIKVKVTISTNNNIVEGIKYTSIRWI